ncbi:MAG: hypothetical protein ACRYGL_01855 [Janthinobacterium lividum]
MSNEKREGSRIATVFTLRMGRETSSRHTAEILTGILREAASALTPIIGREGVPALLKRSVVLTASSHPWLLDAGRNGTSPMGFDMLKVLIEGQTKEEALTGSMTLISQFYGLLSNLIGSSLADRILESAWVDSPRDETAQDHLL